MQEGVSVSQKINMLIKKHSSRLIQGKETLPVYCFSGWKHEFKSISVVFTLQGADWRLARDSRPDKAQMLVRKSVHGLEIVG